MTGAITRTPTVQTPLKTLGNYELLEKVGQGGMGAVYRARQISLDRIVAIKVLPPNLAKDEQFVGRFLREAQSAAQLSHPNLIPVYDAGQADGLYYFSMEFVPGRTLKDLLKDAGPLDEATALRHLAKVAEGLRAAHLKGIVHRDVKPDNILLDERGEPKLADLGLAKPMIGADEFSTSPRSSDLDRLSADLTTAGSALGTPRYMSPEQARGEEADQRSDLYSLGATFYHLLTGNPPFPGKNARELMRQHREDAPAAPRSLRPGLHPRTEKLLLRLLAKDPRQRPQCADDLLRDLAAIEAGTASPPRPAVAAIRRAAGPSPRPANRLPLFIGVGVLVLGGIGLGVLLSRGGAAPAPAPTAGPAPVASVVVEPSAPTVQPPPVSAVATTVTVTAPVVPAESTVPTKPVVDRGAWRQAQVKAQSLSLSGEYDAAFALLDALDPAVAQAFSADLETLRGTLRQEGSERIAKALTKARSLAEAGNRSGARKALDEARAIPYAAGLGEAAADLAAIETSLADAETARLQAAETRWKEIAAPLLDDLCALRTAGLADRVAELQKDPANAELAARLQAVPLVGAALDRADQAMRESYRRQIGRAIALDAGSATARSGTLNKVDDQGLWVGQSTRDPATGVVSTVNLLFTWNRVTPAQRLAALEGVVPDTDHDRVARALLALAAGEASTAEAILARLKQHPLADGLRRRPATSAAVASETSAAQDDSARKAWQNIEKKAGANLDMPAARALLADLATFRADHGASPFFATIANRLDPIEQKARGLLIGANLIDNPGFEKLGDSGGWKPIGSGKIALEVREPHSGRNCLWLLAKGDGTGAGIRRTLRLEAGKTYEVSVWGRCANRDSQVTLTIDDGGKKPLLKREVEGWDGRLVTSWQELSGRFTATGTEAIMTVEASARGPTTDCYLDDLCVREAAAAP